jgi:hypothetical protein
MPLDPNEVQAAMKSGLSAVCATCTKYWEARERGVPGFKCLATDGCGSPIAGDDFHEYVGPLSAGGAMEKFCFVCASPAKIGVRAKGKLRIVGVCEAHLPMLKTHRATNAMKIPEGLPTIVNGKGEIDLEKLLARSKPSFADSLADATQYLDEQERRGKKS